MLKGAPMPSIAGPTYPMATPTGGPTSLSTASPTTQMVVPTAGPTALPSNSYPNCAPSAPPIGMPTSALVLADC